MQDEAERIAARLTEKQREVLAKAKPLVDARILVPAYIDRKKWPEQLVSTYSVAMRRLTPLGLRVRAALLNSPAR